MSSGEAFDQHGHCSSFCQGAINGDHPRSGTTNEDHGAFCLGVSLGGLGRP